MAVDFQSKHILRALIAHDVDFVSDPEGAPPYERLKQEAGEPIEIDGQPVFVASLDHLIAMKEASGRAKDKLMATEYRVLSDELRAPRE